MEFDEKGVEDIKTRSHNKKSVRNRKGEVPLLGRNECYYMQATVSDRHRQPVGAWCNLAELPDFDPLPLYLAVEVF